MDGSRFGFSKARSFAPVIPGAAYPRPEACKAAGVCQNLMLAKAAANHRCPSCQAAYKLASGKRRYKVVKRNREAAK